MDAANTTEYVEWLSSVGMSLAEEPATSHSRNFRKPGYDALERCYAFRISTWCFAWCYSTYSLYGVWVGRGR
jgi:hypothetical protein